MPIRLIASGAIKTSRTTKNSRMLTSCVQFAREKMDSRNVANINAAATHKYTGSERSNRIRLAATMVQQKKQSTQRTGECIFLNQFQPFRMILRRDCAALAQHRCIMESAREWVMRKPYGSHPDAECQHLGRRALRARCLRVPAGRA